MSNVFILLDKTRKKRVPQTCGFTELFDEESLRWIMPAYVEKLLNSKSI
jgi:hypothetical protein